VLCGSLPRPDVVRFNEDRPAETWARAQDAASDGDALFAIGTSMLVHPAAGLPLTAQHAGSP
jgi:NAD-dependent deacetylase